MKQKYILGKYYWVLHNNQPVKAILTSVHADTITNKSINEVIAIKYVFIDITEEVFISENEKRNRLKYFKEEQIFKTLIDIAKYYNLI